MITQSISFSIDCEGQSVSWIIESDDDCVTFSQTSGTVTSGTTTINITATFEDEDCLNNTTITVTATDENGLSTSKVVDVPNPCTSFSGYISKVTSALFPYSYQAIAYGGVEPYTYQWYYDAVIFTEAPNGGDSKNLKLKLKSGISVPANTTITLIVKDQKGCSETIYYTQEFKAPKAKSINARVACLPYSISTVSCGDVTGFVGNIRLEAVSPYGTEIDWGTLDLKVVDGICPTNQQISVDGNATILTIYTKDLPTGDYTLPWTVKDVNGVISNEANLYISVPECTQTNEVYAEPKYYAMNVAEVAGATIEIPVKDLVHPMECCENVEDDKKVDWNTFTFVATSGQTLVSATELTTTNGTAILQRDRTILYTPGLKTCDTDLVQYLVSNEGGQVSNTGKIVFDWERLSAPTANADTACVECGQTVDIDVLTNDTGSIDPNSVVVTSQPTKGNYTIGTDGVIRYTASSNKSGDDYIGYKVSNPDGEQSAQATVTVSIACTGPDVTGNICKTTIDLTSYLPAYATAGGTWGQSGSNPSVLVLTVPTAVDFSGATAGVYNLSYTASVTGGCSSRVDLYLTLFDDQANDDCANALTMAYPQSAGNTVRMDAQLITDCATDSAVALPAGWYADYEADVWYEFTTNSVVDAKLFVDSTKYAAGLENIQIAVYSGACGALVDVASASTKSGERYLEINLAGLTAATTYTVRISGSNRGSFTVGLTA